MRTHAHVGLTAQPSSTPAPGSTNAPDIGVWSSLALAIATFVLAAVAFWQARLSKRAIIQTKEETEKDFALQALRQAESLTPIVVAEASSKKASAHRHLALRNVGQGPAINARFSGSLNGQMFTAAQYSVPAIAPQGVTETSLLLHKDFESRWPIYELLIRYEDIFGNTYSTEYVRFAESSEWYLWRRPWLGKDLGIARPENCSEDNPSWGFNSRVYFDAQKGLY